MKTETVIAEHIEPANEITRLGEAYSWQSITFVVLSVCGLLTGIAYLFGLTWGGRRMLEGEYYWIFIGFFAAAAFLALPAKAGQTKVPLYDVVAAIVIFAVSFYFATNAWEMVQAGWSNLTLGIVVWLLMMELARRSGGLPFLLVVVLIGLYPLAANIFPGPIMGVPYEFGHMLESYIFRAEGMMGITTKIVAEIILGFLVFAGILLATGAGTFFIDLANASFGRYRGGPAKVAVVASAFMGSLSGSIFSNIAGTGSITIGVDYAVIMIAAILPSLLFYFGLILQVDAYAARTGIKGMPKEDLPSTRKVLKSGWPFLFVMVFLMWGLLYMRWEYYTPWYACILMIGLSFLRKETRITPARLFSALRQIGVLVTQTAAIILPIAFVVSALTITGVTGSVTSGLVGLGGDNVFMVILFGIIACFIMGMAGLAIVAYIFLAVTLAPAIIEVGGLNTIAVHFFIVYYAMLSAITPPVGAAAFLAGTIAGAKPMKTSITAMRLIYFVPLFFLFQPALLLQGDLTPLVYVLPSIIAGIMLISGGLEGYLLGAGLVKTWQRLPMVAAGFAFSFPGLMTTLIGGLASAVLVAMVWQQNRIKPGLA